MMPDDVLRAEMMQMDIETIIDFLDKYQKKRPEWDDFRGKIPESLLQKWGRVLKICRENGFINPVAKNGKIIFSQILSHKRNRKNSDKCTLCTNNFIDYTCKGKIKNRNFVPCWG